jgi:hypothetical protein
MESGRSGVPRSGEKVKKKKMVVPNKSSRLTWMVLFLRESQSLRQRLNGRMTPISREIVRLHVERGKASLRKLDNARNLRLVLYSSSCVDRLAHPPGYIHLSVRPFMTALF